jgi:large subunit ribosomal protein L15
MNLQNLSPAKGSTRNNVRLGRGQGSGGGGTAKRGHKGAKSRSGYSAKRGFEGGQMPLQRRVPKFGFNNINRIEYKAINLDTLQALFEKTGANVVDIAFMRSNGLIAKSDIVKVLGRGELKAKLAVTANAFSQSAIDAIQKAGGSATTANGVAAAASGVVVTETVVEEAPVKVTKAKKSNADDLKIIEGIGPKIAELLIAAGIDTFQKLADANVEDLSKILVEAGSNFASHNPTTWPEQSALAAAGKMDELKELQDRLMGGRPE